MEVRSRQVIIEGGRVMTSRIRKFKGLFDSQKGQTIHMCELGRRFRSFAHQSNENNAFSQCDMLPYILREVGVSGDAISR